MMNKILKFTEQIINSDVFIQTFRFVYVKTFCAEQEVDKDNKYKIKALKKKFSLQLIFKLPKLNYISNL